MNMKKFRMPNNSEVFNTSIINIATIIRSVMQSNIMYNPGVTNNNVNRARNAMASS